MTITIDSLVFSLDGWTLSEREENERIWHNSEGDALILNFFPTPDPLPFEAGNLSSFREFTRSLSEMSGSYMVEAEILKKNDLDLYQTIYKFPQEPSGMTYLGGISLNYGIPSYAIRFECPEHGTTGVRDTLVAAKTKAAMEKPGLISSLLGRITGSSPEPWFEDPYDRSYTKNVGRNRSDDQQWDELFPTHPLSRSRRYLDTIFRTLALK